MSGMEWLGVGAALIFITKSLLTLENDLNPQPETLVKPVATGSRSRGIAAALAFFLGGFGIHKFYLNQPGWGIVYALFCWTLIPALVAGVEAICLCFTSNETFAAKYGG